MLRRPHLMLADLGRYERVHAARRVEQRLHRALRHDVGARLLLFGEVEAARRAPAVDAAPPFAKEIGRASCRERECQYVSIRVVAGQYKKQLKNNVCRTRSSEIIN